MQEPELEGLWSYTANEVCGEKHTPELVARMSKLVFLVGEYLPDWDGLWAAVTYGYQGGTWSPAEVFASCRHLVLGTDREGVVPASDFYVWAGGRFRIRPSRSPKEIDFEPVHKAFVKPAFVQLGIYRLDAGRLTLCISDPGDARPSQFTSMEGRSRQSVGELVRT